MDHTIIVGTDLNGRKIITNIPDTTEITELKYIAKVNDNNYIAENKMTVEGQTEECSVGYYHYNDAIYIFYIRNSSEVVTNLTNFTLPDDFGVCTEIDNTAVLYNYIKRNCHEKVYVICEDFCKEESMTKGQIKDNINEQVRGYGVPVDTVMGFTGTEDEIPPGFELSDEEIGSGGSSGSGADDVPINTIVEYDGTSVPDGWEEVGFDVNEDLCWSGDLVGTSFNQVLSAEFPDSTKRPYRYRLCHVVFRIDNVSGNFTQYHIVPIRYKANGDSRSYYSYWRKDANTYITFLLNYNGYSGFNFVIKEASGIDVTDIHCIEIVGIK